MQSITVSMQLSMYMAIWLMPHDGEHIPNVSPVSPRTSSVATTWQIYHDYILCRIVCVNAPIVRQKLSIPGQSPIYSRGWWGNIRGI